MRTSKSVKISVLGLLAVLVVGTAARVAIAAGSPDFTVAGTPSSQNVQQGKSVSFTVNVNSTNGFTGTVGLAVSGVPTGSTGTVSPTSVDLAAGSAKSAALTFAAGKSTPLGAYTLTLTGTSGKKVHTATVSVTIQQAAGTLGVSSSPTTATVAPSGSAVYTMTFARTGSAVDAPATLTTSALPSGVTSTFSPNPATGGSATLTLATSSSVAAGSYGITVAAATSAATATTSVTLVVQTTGKVFAISGNVIGLSPGVSLPVDLVLSNPNSQSISVTNLSIAASISVPATKAGGCSSADFAVTQYSGTYPFTLPAGTTKLSLLVPQSQLPTVRMLDTKYNQDDCKSQTVTLTFSGTATGN